MYTLDNVSTVVEDLPNVFCVYGTGEVWVAVVSAVLLGVPAAGLLADLQEVVSANKSLKIRKFSTQKSAESCLQTTV